MGIKFNPLGPDFVPSSSGGGGGGGANTTLSNLTSPTAINQTLLTDGTSINIGNDSGEAFGSMFLTGGISEGSTGIEFINIANRTINDIAGTPTLDFSDVTKLEVTKSVALPNDIYLTGRDATDTLDLSLVKIDTSNRAILGDDTTTYIGVQTAIIELNAGGNDISLTSGLISLNTDEIEIGGGGDGLLSTNPGINQNLTVESGFSSGTSTGNANFKSGDSGANNSGNVFLLSGSAINTSGDITVSPGTGTTRGKIKFVDGSEGTAGYIWTSTDTAGTGEWQPSTGGNVGATRIRFTKDDNQVIPNVLSTFQVVEFDDPDYDNSATAFVDGVFTVPAGQGGFYQICVNMTMESTGTGAWLSTVRNNGSEVCRGGRNNVTGTVTTGSALSTILQVADGDVVDFGVFNETGANIQTEAFGPSNTVSIMRLI